MATGNITKSAVDRLARGWLWDSRVIGFGARRQTDGVYYYIRYRHGGRQRMISLGRHGSPWTPDTARNEARRLLGEVAGGIDPGAKARTDQPLGVEIERYLAARQPSLKPRSFIETQHHLRQHAKPLHRVGLAEIDRRTIAELLGRIETGSGPIARNRVRSSLSAFFKWTITEGLLEANPVTGTATANEGGSRSRVLTDAELRLVWRCLGQDQYSDVVRLLILTGQRREEIGGLRWSEIDCGAQLPISGADYGSIRLPPERVKNSQEHRLPLSRRARVIIDRQPRRNSSPFIFGSGDRGFVNWSNSKDALDSRIADEVGSGTMPSWRLHDLRRTMATRLGDLGILPHVVEAILNHVGGFRSGVAGVYNLARYEGDMREALTRWADYVEGLSISQAEISQTNPTQGPSPCARGGLKDAVSIAGAAADRTFSGSTRRPRRSPNRWRSAEGR
jgi:integrase